ncbi:MAG: 50S ribosomal protein L17 [Spirochaetales bacterium]|nr:50S ribosomal protein L17 [Spirochaetales bacterium]
MNNKTGFNRLSRRAGQRRALLKNMVTSLFKYERITTTKAKALEVRRAAEKMITRAKVDSVHNRREIAKTITNEVILKKLFSDIGPRFVSRAGGYTRILKLGQRFGDAAEMVFLEFVQKGVTAEAAPEEKSVKGKKAPGETPVVENETKSESTATAPKAKRASKPKTAKEEAKV